MTALGNGRRGAALPPRAWYLKVIVGGALWRRCDRLILAEPGRCSTTLPDLGDQNSGATANPIRRPYARHLRYPAARRPRRSTIVGEESRIRRHHGALTRS